MVLEILQVLGLFALAIVAVLGWFIARRWDRERFIREQKTWHYSSLDDTITQSIQAINGLVTLNDIDWDSTENVDALVMRVILTGLPYISREAFDRIFEVEEPENTVSDEDTKKGLEAFAGMLLLEATYTLQELKREFRLGTKDLLELVVPDDVAKALSDLGTQLQGGLDAIGVAALLRHAGLEEATDKFDVTKWRDMVFDSYDAFEKARRADMARMLRRK